jgi:hypothetical protein
VPHNRSICLTSSSTRWSQRTRTVVTSLATAYTSLAAGVDVVDVVVVGGVVVVVGVVKSKSDGTCTRMANVAASSAAESS